MTQKIERKKREIVEEAEERRQRRIRENERDSRAVKQAVVEIKSDEKKINALSASIFMLGLFSGSFSAIICKMAYDTK
jgi:ADP-ribosylglycohydrolase